MCNISVCIPTFNQAQYLGSCIESVLNQTRLPDEIIISDDNSTDNTDAIVKKYLQGFTFIKAFKQPVNLGLSRNSDFCLQKAKGEFIVRLSSDDLLLPRYIMQLSQLLQQHADAGYAHSAVNEINAIGKITKTRRLFRKNLYESGLNSLKNSLYGFKVAANIIMFRKHALEQVDYINCTENFAEDYFLSVEIAAKGYGNVYYNEPLACYRIWDDKANVRIKRKINEINGLREVFNNAITPAFIERKWSLKQIEKAKSNFAIAQSNALGWNNFSLAEKENLKLALLIFSSTPKSKFFYFINSSRAFRIFNAFRNSKSFLKNKFKQVLLIMRSLSA